MAAILVWIGSEVFSCILVFALLFLCPWLELNESMFS